MTEQIDRLASVSRVLFEQRILDLQKENLELRKRVTDLEHGDVVLNALLASVNDTGLTEVCVCPACYCSKRYADLEPEEVVKRLKTAGTNNDSNNPPECLLRKCLLWQCDQLGLIHQTFNASEDSGSESDDEEENSGSENDSDDALSYDSDKDSWSAYDSMAVFRERAQRLNCHVVIVNTGQGTWGVVYGKKFAKNGLFKNPDTEKIKTLFELLKDGEKFFKVDGLDYFRMADDRQSDD